MTPHEVLGLPEDATEEDAKAAYRRLAQMHHPDRGGDPQIFLTIGRALKDFRRKLPCQLCSGKGYIETRSGLAICRDPCPKCWRK